jgi:hypothetical protein
LPEVTLYGFGWLTPIAYGGSAGVGVWPGPVFEGSVAAGGGGVGDIGGFVWNASLRAGWPFGVPSQGRVWSAVLPELGVRAWVGEGFFGTASASWETGTLPVSSRFGVYGRFGGGIGVPIGLDAGLIPEVLLGIGVARFRAPQ